MGSELKHGKKMRCKHAFRPISAGFAAIQLGIQGWTMLILCSNFYFHKFFNFCQTNFVYKALLRITRSAHDRAISGAKSRSLYAGKYGMLKFCVENFHNLEKSMSYAFSISRVSELSGQNRCASATLNIESNTHGLSNRKNCKHKHDKWAKLK
jgi:hypothetical protein